MDCSEWNLRDDNYDYMADKWNDMGYMVYGMWVHTAVLFVIELPSVEQNYVDFYVGFVPVVYRMQIL